MTGLMAPAPPPQARELYVWVLRGSTQLRGLRDDLRVTVNTFARTGDTALVEVAENMVLVATELATNAVKHGLPPTTVRLLHTVDQFVIDVADHDLTTIPELGDTGPAKAGGRGLYLARELSQQVGWYATDHTKHVWATFPLRP